MAPSTKSLKICGWKGDVPKIYRLVHVAPIERSINVKTKLASFFQKWTKGTQNTILSAYGAFFERSFPLAWPLLGIHKTVKFVIHCANKDFKTFQSSLTCIWHHFSYLTAWESTISSTLYNIFTNSSSHFITMGWMIINDRCPEVNNCVVNQQKLDCCLFFLQYDIRVLKYQVDPIPYGNVHK